MIRPCAMSRVGDNETSLAANRLYQSLITQHGDRLARRATGYAVDLLQVALGRHATARRQLPASDLLTQRRVTKALIKAWSASQEDT